MLARWHVGTFFVSQDGKLVYGVSFGAVELISEVFYAFFDGFRK